MCGIIGLITQADAKQRIVEELYKLDYRGYDSAGIAVINGGKIDCYKQVGSIDNLKNSLKNLNFCAVCGIGHTRWATHGKPDIKNCHPHLSYDNRWAIVHNGIIENYNEIKKQLSKEGIKLKSGTDSEVVAHLLAKNKNDDIFNLIEVCKALRGSWALACINKNCENELFLAKYNSPLFVAKTKDEIMISSDTISFMGKTDCYFHLRNDEFAHIKGTSLTFYDASGKIIIKDPIKLNYISKDADKADFSHFMLKEIFEIPHLLQIVGKFYLQNKELIYDFKQILETCGSIFLIGCGTAYHSALIAEFYFKKFFNKNITAHIASEFIYSSTYIKQGDICIFVSQSGETADTISAMKHAKGQGATCIALTNNLNSHLAFLCDYVWPILAGPEIAVASTKAYNCQCLAFLLVAMLSKDNEYYINSHGKFPSNIEGCSAGAGCVTGYKKRFNFSKNINIISSRIQNMNLVEIQELARAVDSAEKVFFIGRSVDFVTAQEASLKLKEISYINSLGVSSGELKHGTLALIDKNCIVINIITQENIKAKSINSIYEVKARGARVAVVSPFEDIREICTGGDMFIKLFPCDPLLMPQLSIVPLQLLAYYVSVGKGINPDKPRNLAKSVTVE